MKMTLNQLLVELDGFKSCDQVTSDSSTFDLYHSLFSSVLLQHRQVARMQVRPGVLNHGTPCTCEGNSAYKEHRRTRRPANGSLL